MMGAGYHEEIATVKRNIPYITVILIIINTIVFFIMEWIGDTQDSVFLLEHGAMYVPSVLEDGEWYRVITHMFIHSGYEHLINNMIMLAAVGYYIEKDYGSLKFMITYFIGGLGATIASALPEIMDKDYIISIGASGAIMAMFAVMLIMIFKERKNLGQNIGIRLLVLLALMVFGNMQEGVDWMAHLGGAVTGLIVAAIWYRPKNKSISIEF